MNLYIDINVIQIRSIFPSLDSFKYVLKVFHSDSYRRILFLFYIPKL